MKTLFRICPPFMWLYRCLIYLFAELKHGAFVKGSFLSKVGKGWIKLLETVNFDWSILQA
jgi:hypothetical protein